MKKLTTIIWILFFLMALSFFAEAFLGNPNFAEDWVMPLAAMFLTLLIPISWIAYFKRRNKWIPNLKQKASALLFIPIWLLAGAISLVALYWLAPSLA